MTKIGKEATSAKFSAEGQALEYEGTIYVSDGADDVFAMDANDRRRPLDLPAEPAPGSARRSRLLWLGQPRRRDRRRHGLRLAAERRPGRARPGNRPGHLVHPVVKPGSGFSITSAPLYYDGKVYVGGSGGEYGVRGRLTALDAETGKVDWRFYTTPSAEGNGRQHLADNGSYKHGGASLWNTPSGRPQAERDLPLDSQARLPWVGSEREGRQPLHRLDRRPRTPKPANTSGTTSRSTTTSGTSTPPRRPSSSTGK